MQVTPAIRSGRSDGTHRRKDLENVSGESGENDRVLVDEQTTNTENSSAGTRDMSTRGQGELSTRSLRSYYSYGTNSKGKSPEISRVNKNNINEEQDMGQDSVNANFTSVRKYGQP